MLKYYTVYSAITPWTYHAHGEVAKGMKVLKHTYSFELTNKHWIDNFKLWSENLQYIEISLRYAFYLVKSTFVLNDFTK